MKPWPDSVERVAACLREKAVDARLEEFATGTRTAEAAAAAVGCDASQIVKSLVFVCDGRPVLALVPGDRRADPKRIALAVKAGYARVASRDEVVGATGFSPGAVSPLPAPHVSCVLIERGLLEHDIVWAGAGSPRHMVALAAHELARVTEAEIADLVAD